jgi:hypothetical protein
MKLTEFFKKDYWLLDAPVGIVFGLLVGYEWQRTADSSEINTDKLIISMLIGGFSYLLIFVLSFFLKEFRKFPSWFCIGVIGSVLFVFNKAVIEYFIDNLSYKEMMKMSWSQYLSATIFDMALSFLLLSIIYAFILSLFLLSFRLPIFLFNGLKKTFP